MIKLMLNFFVLYIISFLSILFHELGHCLTYKFLYNCNDWNIDIGAGKTILSLWKFNIKLIPIRGMAYFNNKYDETEKLKNFFVYLNGPLINLLISLIMIYFIINMNKSPKSFNNFYRNIIFYIFYLNLFKGIENLLPMKYIFGETDGLKILNIIKKQT